MNPRWVIQKNIFKEDLDVIIQALHKNKIAHYLIDVIPFSENLSHIPKHNGPNIAYGSTTLMRLVSPSWVWYNDETFKPSVWGKQIGNDYLNKEATIMPLKEVLNNWSGRLCFIRPNSDFKLFNGDVFMKGDFEDWYKRVESLIKSGTYVNLKLDTNVSVAPYQKLLKEWRFFVVNKNVVTGSQYRADGHLLKSKSVDTGALELATKIAKMDWQLAPGYAVDIVLMEDSKYKVIEFNNFNSSGFYLCDIEAILLAATKFIALTRSFK